MDVFEERNNVRDVDEIISGVPKSSLEATTCFVDLAQVALWERPDRTCSCGSGKGASLSGESVLHNKVSLQDGT
jgi:hypothetical protein